jgi:hypothetical protein
MSIKIAKEVKENVAKLWPWLSTDKSNTNITEEQLEEFYKWTYTYDTDDWSKRLVEHADEEEAWHAAFVYKLCLQFELDGSILQGESGKSKPSLSFVWNDLHQRIICPYFKKGIIENVHEHLVTWSSKTYKLDEKQVFMIWRTVEDWGNLIVRNEEYDWDIQHVYTWLLEDKEYQNKKKLEIVKENPETNTIAEEVKKPIAKLPKKPMPKFTSKTKVVKSVTTETS